MRILSTIALCFIFVLPLAAQQDPMYSMYMFNRLALNPAYAGSRTQLAATLLARRQWIGMQGAPQTASFAIHTPTPDQRHGFGLLAIADRTTFTTNTLATGIYNYRIPIGTGHLGLGLQMGVNTFNVRQGQIDTWDPGDPAFESPQDFSKGMFVAGPGIYYSNEHWFAGASIPDIVPHKLYDQYYEALIARHFWHHYLMGGLMLDLSPHVSLKPSFLLKAVRGAPLAFDLNMSVLLSERIWLGATWRPRNAWILITEFYLTKSLRIGYAYDVPTNTLRNYSTGSHELVLGLDFGFAKRKIVSPKLF